MPIMVEGKKMEKSQEDMSQILEYLKTGPQNLSSFDYKDWDDSLTEKVMSVIRSTVPDGRLINDIMSGVSSASSTTKAETKSESSDFFNEVSSTKTSSMKSNESFIASPTKSSGSASSLDELYADL
jgi:hypothetical protein